MFKKAAKATIASILGWQVRKLLRKKTVKVVAVVGSMGKTSTKLAIAAVLKEHFRVQYQDGNYNDILTVPLVLFGHANPPNLANPFAWVKIFASNRKQIKGGYLYDIAVLELGTDHPGDIAAFAKYLRVDVAVLTAIAPEHMEFFANLDAVAQEELSVTSYSNTVIANRDLCGDYLKGHQPITYGLHDANFYFSKLSFNGVAYNFTLHETTREILTMGFTALADTELYCVLAAVAVARQFDFPAAKLLQSIKQISPAPGRMRPLKGVNGSRILDDTYNASPEAAKAALDTLYKLEAPSRIALLGNMNELGEYSEAAHTEVGDYCEPAKLDLVITLGPNANAYLAPAAIAAGCQVKTADSPYQAAEIIKPLLKEGVILLAKGSQNGVFAEEAVKQLLADPADANQLVRQSPDWLAKKAKQFTKQ
jgi:UDP-N-acetylmuramyl pentapeptide synthase